jgi:hypothetical protein
VFNKPGLVAKHPTPKARMAIKSLRRSIVYRLVGVTNVTCQKKHMKMQKKLLHENAEETSYAPQLEK